MQTNLITAMTWSPVVGRRVNSVVDALRAEPVSEQRLRFHCQPDDRRGLMPQTDTAMVKNAAIDLTGGYPGI